MIKIKYRICLIIFLCFFLLSCSGFLEPSKSSLISKINSTAYDTSSGEIQIVFDQLKNNSISSILLKMKKQSNLSNSDYSTICNFILTNHNESLSEEVGYNLYSYLKGIKIRNNNFRSFLQTKDSAFKARVLVALVEIMCIELGEDHNKYEKIISDFSILKGNNSALKALKFCINNQLE